jgi:O-succinylbenzoic acid--CoA ligase
VAFLPLDHRFTDGEKRAILDRAEPAAVLDASGELTVFAGARPVDPAVAAIVATSGTGGATRLAELSRDAVASAVAGSFAGLTEARGGIAPDREEPWTLCLSPAHVGGLLVLLRCEIHGAPVTALGGFDPLTLVAASPPGANVALVPTMLGRLVGARAPLDRFGTLLVGGGPIPESVRTGAVALGGAVVGTYGMTETTGGVVYDGRPFERTSVRLGGDGELEIHGPTLMEGYRSDPGATAGAFTVDGWLRTGDVGTVADDGSVTVEGRLDDLIRTGAEKVWPEEVEAALAAHPKVREVAVAGRPDPEWGQRVAAWVVPARIDDPPTLEELRAFGADRLARFKLPRSLSLVAGLPLTPSGKLRRADLGD